MSLHDFVRSYAWSVITTERDEDLRTFRKLYEYFEVFLIDFNGNILYTAGAASDLGTNLFDGPFSNTRFAETVRRARDSGRPTFSDLEPYAASGQSIAGFFASVILDDDGQKVGVFAIQITPRQIEYAMHSDSSSVTSIDSYVVGQAASERAATLRTHAGQDHSDEQGAPADDGASETGDYLRTLKNRCNGSLWRVRPSRKSWSRRRKSFVRARETCNGPTKPWQKRAAN